MPRLIRVFAGRTVTLLVLSCRGSNYVPAFCNWFHRQQWYQVQRKVQCIEISQQQSLIFGQTGHGKDCRSSLIWVTETSKFRLLDYKIRWQNCLKQVTCPYLGQIDLSKQCRSRSGPREAIWSGSTLFAIPSTSFGCNTLMVNHLVKV